MDDHTTDWTDNLIDSIRSIAREEIEKSSISSPPVESQSVSLTLYRVAMDTVERLDKENKRLRDEIEALKARN